MRVKLRVNSSPRVNVEADVDPILRCPLYCFFRKTGLLSCSEAQIHDANGNGPLLNLDDAGVNIVELVRVSEVGNRFIKAGHIIATVLQPNADIRKAASLHMAK